MLEAKLPLPRGGSKQSHLTSRVLGKKRLCCLEGLSQTLAVFIAGMFILSPLDIYSKSYSSWFQPVIISHFLRVSLGISIPSWD